MLLLLRRGAYLEVRYLHLTSTSAHPAGGVTGGRTMGGVTPGGVTPGGVMPGGVPAGWACKAQTTCRNEFIE